MSLKQDVKRDVADRRARDTIENRVHELETRLDSILAGIYEIRAAFSDPVALEVVQRQHIHYCNMYRIPIPVRHDFPPNPTPEQVDEACKNFTLNPYDVIERASQAQADQGDT